MRKSGLLFLGQPIAAWLYYNTNNAVFQQPGERVGGCFVLGCFSSILFTYGNLGAVDDVETSVVTKDTAAGQNKTAGQKIDPRSSSLAHPDTKTTADIMGFYYLDIIIAAAAAITWGISATNAAADDPTVDLLQQDSEAYNISGLVESDPPSEVEHVPFMYSKHVCDPAIATIMAWLVLVIGLEIHDFHYHLKLAHSSAAVASANDIDDDNENYGGVKIRRRLSVEFVSDEKYIASLEAVRLGLRDAIIDAIVVYSIMYAIVIGMTWSDVEPNFLLVIQGIGYIVSACILTSTGWKIPQWVRFTFYFVCCIRYCIRAVG